jgi:hypothetical protein
MGAPLIYDDQTVGTVGQGAVQIFLYMIQLVQVELEGMPCGFSPLVSEEIWIDRECFVKFVDEFFSRAARDGKFRYLSYWASEMAGMYENVTGTSPVRKMSGVEDFRVRRYGMRE